MTLFAAVPYYDSVNILRQLLSEGFYFKKPIIEVYCIGVLEL